MIRNKISIKLACYSRFQILIITEFTIVISCLKFKYHYNSYNHLTISQIPTTIYSPKIILNIATLLKFTIITQIIINNHSKTNNLNQKKRTLTLATLKRTASPQIPLSSSITATTIFRNDYITVAIRRAIED